MAAILPPPTSRDGAALPARLNGGSLSLGARVVRATPAQGLPMTRLDMRRLRSLAPSRRTAMTAVVCGALALGLPAVSRDARACDLTGYAADCRGANFDGRTFAGERLDGANFSGASFVGADLQGVDLYRADLSGANLRNANLQRAVLHYATLDDADFTGAVLTNAGMRSASLLRARFTDAETRGLDLSGAKLGGAVWMDGTVCAADSIGRCER